MCETKQERWQGEGGADNRCIEVLDHTLDHPPLLQVLAEGSEELLPLKGQHPFHLLRNTAQHFAHNVGGQGLDALGPQDREDVLRCGGTKELGR